MTVLVSRNHGRIEGINKRTLVIRKRLILALKEKIPDVDLRYFDRRIRGGDGHSAGIERWIERIPIDHCTSRRSDLSNHSELVMIASSGFTREKLVG